MCITPKPQTTYPKSVINFVKDNPKAYNQKNLELLSENIPVKQCDYLFNIYSNDSHIGFILCCLQVDDYYKSFYADKYKDYPIYEVEVGIFDEFQKAGFLSKFLNLITSNNLLKSPCILGIIVEQENPLKRKIFNILNSSKFECSYNDSDAPFEYYIVIYR